VCRPESTSTSRIVSKLRIDTCSLSGLVLAQRAYQMNARLLQAGDQILETINNLRR
jgi:hypothetical protein